MESIKNIKIDLKELEVEKEKNFKERLKFIDYWTNYIKKSKNDSWNEQQNLLINGQTTNS